MQETGGGQAAPAEMQTSNLNLAAHSALFLSSGGGISHPPSPLAHLP